MTRVLVVGDIGQPVYHVGDEAMTISTAEYLADAGMQVILATRDAEQSKRYLGAGGSSAYEYMPFLLFPWAPAKREITLERLEEFLVSGVMPDLPDFCPSAQQIRDFVEGIQSVDAVVISGGGNLNSRYGWLLYERAAIALVAQYAKIPVFVSGQSIGPVLSPRDEEVLLRMLRSAASVAVRERSSYEWCREHDLKALAGVDDASDYRAHTPEITLDYADARVEVPDLPERYVCVTVHEVSGSKVHELASLLDKIYAEYGLAAVFLGHMGDPASEGGRTGDYKAHELVAASMTSPAAVIPILHADATVRIHQGAALNITDRYHPAVFSLSAGIPAVALVPDAFTEMRICGVMGHYGMQNFMTPLHMLGTDIPEKLIASALSLSRGQRQELRARHEAVTALLHAWREYLAASVRREKQAHMPEGISAAAVIPALEPSLEAINNAVRELLLKTSLAEGTEWALSDRMHSWEAHMRGKFERAEDELQALKRSRMVRAAHRTSRQVQAMRHIGSRFR